MKNKKAQVIIVNLMLLVVVIIVAMAFVPIFQESISNARGSDGLNCVSTLRVCGNQSEPCYNSSLDSQTTSCLIMDIYLPYILIIILLMGVAGLMSGRSGMFGMGQQQQPAQPGYAPQY